MESSQNDDLTGNLYRRLNEATAEAIITADETNVILQVNPAAERMFSRSRHDLIGRAVTDLMPERYREEHHAGLRRLLSSSETRIVGKTLEVAGRRNDGSEFPIELDLSKQSALKKTFFTAIIREAKQGPTANAPFLKHADLVEMLNAFRAGLFEGADFTAAFQVVREEFRRHLGVSGCELWLYDEISEGLINDHVVEMIRHGAPSNSSRAPIGRKLADNCFAVNKTIVITDFSSADLIQHEMTPSGAVKSVAALPIHAENRLIGVLQLGDATSDRFSGQSVVLFEILADQMGAMIEISRAEKAAEKPPERTGNS